ncbi:MAG: DUF1816 domain-containing protein [Synechococcus sp.]
MNNLLTGVAEALGLAYWVVVTTENPACVYYFGPFLRQQEAEDSKSGYIADLETEGAMGITAEVKKCRKPNKLTEDSSAAVEV